jgi:hypothetical protein
MRAPVLIGDGHPTAKAAPAALASTFVTSAVGVVTFTLLAAHHHGRPPDWPTGILLGIGGLAGGYVGARLQHRLPEAAIRRGLGVVVVAVGEYPLITGSVSPIGHGHAGLHVALGHLGTSDRLGSADGHPVQSSDDRLGSDRG